MGRFTHTRIISSAGCRSTQRKSTTCIAWLLSGGYVGRLAQRTSPTFNQHHFQNSFLSLTQSWRQFFPPDFEKELKTNKNLASEQGVVLQCFREKDGWGPGRAVRRRCGLYWFSFFLGNQNKGKMVNIWFVSFPILSIYHQKVFTGWWYNLYHFSFLLLKIFSFSKSNTKNMTNIWFKYH